MGIIACLRSLIERLLRAQELLDPALLEEPPRRPRDEAFPAVLLPGEHHHDDPTLHAGAEHHLSQEDDSFCWDAGDDAAL
jgi:hypothetical protein